MCFSAPQADKAGLEKGELIFGYVCRQGHQESNLNLASEDTSVTNAPKCCMEHNSVIIEPSIMHIHSLKWYSDCPGCRSSRDVSMVQLFAPMQIALG